MNHSWSHKVTSNCVLTCLLLKMICGFPTYNNNQNGLWSAYNPSPQPTSESNLYSPFASSLFSQVTPKSPMFSQTSLGASIFNPVSSASPATTQV